MFRAIILSIALLFGCTNCVTEPQIGQTTQATQEANGAHLFAGPVTVSIPVENTSAFDAVNIPEPPPWGFFSSASNFGNYYIPIHGLPVGSVVSKVQARVFAQQYSLCETDLWRMNDFFAVEPAPFGVALSQVGAGAVTLTINANVTVTSLTKLYLVLKGRPASECLIMAAEVTYSPPA